MRDRILQKVGSRNLGRFLPLSVGFHLSLFFALTLFVPEINKIQVLSRPIEVSLLPVIAREEPVILPKPSLTKTEIRKEEKRLLQEEGRVEAVEKKVEEPEVVPSPLTSSVPVEIKPSASVPVEIKPPTAADEPPGPLSKQDEIRILVASRGDTLPHLLSSPEPRGVTKYSSLSGEKNLPETRLYRLAEPKYAENPKPIYPKEARKRGYEGEVLLKVQVLPNGRVGQIEVKHSSGHETLDRSALAAVKEWKFIPAREGEKAIPLWVNIPIKFQLQ